MPPTRRYTAAQVAEALRKARGIKKTAAHLLGCTRRTVNSYIQLFPTVREAYDEARDDLVDTAEEQLIKAVDAGHWPAVHFTLVTLGQDRGYNPGAGPAFELSTEDEWLEVHETITQIYAPPEPKPAQLEAAEPAQPEVPEKAPDGD